MTAARARHAAFTLIEVVVALAVILILAAVALPNVSGYLDQQRVEATKAQLETVRDALFNTTAGALAFRQKVGSNAGRLSELDSTIVSANATLTDDSCGNAFSGGERNNWQTNGPFMTYNSDRTSGMMTPIGLAEDTLTRDASYNPARLRLTFLSVSLSEAQLLDQLVENDGFNAGLLHWTPQNGTNGKVVMYYFVQIDNVC